MCRDDKLKNAIEAMIHQKNNMNIFLINPSDITEDILDILPDDCYFVLNKNIESGTAFLIVGDDLKQIYIEFICKHPSKALRGRKSCFEFYDLQ